MGAKESAVAKSTGDQDRDDMLPPPDAALYRVIETRKKVPKREAQYRVQERGGKKEENSSSHHHRRRRQRHSLQSSCVKCKFNLGDEGTCHVVAGRVDNERGISKFFSPKGVGMLPGDIVWEFVKRNGRKLPYSRGHVIAEGAPGFQCQDCKYYLYSRRCLIVEGNFRPEMSCGYIVKVDSGTKI
jgi:hypothetical protein